MYNGHKNWNHWNVSLWLFNDETLYRMVLRCLHRSATKENAARWIAGLLDGQSTPDGAPYTYTSIRAALVGVR